MKPFSILAALSLVSISSAQQSFLETARLFAPQPVAQSQLGTSVAISGDWCAAGAPLETGPNGGGFVYLYERVGGYWLHRGRIQPASGAVQFGWSVALDGNRLVVGDIGYGAKAGRVHVYRGSNSWWLEEASIQGAGVESLGSAVDIEGDRLAVGAFSRFNSIAGDPGHAYVFAWDGATWVQEALLPNGSGITPDAEFGDAIALDGDRVAVGARLHSSGRGGVWTYTRAFGIWSEEAAIASPSGEVNAEFGRALALSDAWLFVGVPFEDSPGQSDGSVRVFERNGVAWNLSSTLVAPTTILGDRVGASVAWDGQFLIAGAPVDYALGGPASGSVHVWTHDASGWTHFQKIFPTNPGLFIWFGSAVAIDGATIVVGEPSDNVLGPVVGSARVFELETAVGMPLCIGTAAACPCGNAGLGDAGCRNSYQVNGATGGTLLYAYGIASVTQDSLRLHTVRTPPSASAVLAQGAPGVTPSVWGDGLRCLGASGVVRLGTRPSVGGTRTDPEFGMTGLSVQGGIPAAGTTVVYQVLYRDVGSWCTADLFNSSNALEVTWSP